MKSYIRILILGFLSWFIPYIASFLFFSRQGVLQIDQGLFKSIMVVVGNLSGVWLLAIYFKRETGDYLRKGVLVGLIWLAMNWVLDFAALLPLSHQPLRDYMYQIGLRYLAIPIISIGMSYALQRRAG